MENQFNRTDRIAEIIHRELIKIMQEEVADPRFAQVTINQVTVSRDLAHAKVYVTFLVPDNEIAKDLSALNRARGFFRTQLARRLQLRIVPELNFIYDETLKRSNYLSDLIDSAIAKDKRTRES